MTEAQIAGVKFALAELAKRLQTRAEGAGVEPARACPASTLFKSTAVTDRLDLPCFWLRKRFYAGVPGLRSVAGLAKSDR